MAKLSKIFSLASVSKFTESNWKLLEETRVKFSKSDLKLISSCTVYNCNGSHGEYKAVKIDVPSLNNSYWFTLDAKSAKAWEHQDDVDPQNIVVYHLQSADDEKKVITRCRNLD